VQSIPVVGKPLGNIIGNIQQSNRNPPAAVPPSSSQVPGIPVIPPSNYTPLGQSQTQTQQQPTTPAKNTGLVDVNASLFGGPWSIILIILGLFILKKAKII
jgi:hypothetical protein